MVSRSSNPQPAGYPTLRSALGGEAMRVPKGSAVRIEPRMAGPRKRPILPPTAAPERDTEAVAADSDPPPVAAPMPEPAAAEGQGVCFQCPSCSAWLRIDDPAAYAGHISQCPTCQVSIVGPQIA
ncbi:MAG: hypothetical protein ACI9R3_000910 [Verrucomicrobiales bacterium]|jgi:hypothetical protein